MSYFDHSTAGRATNGPGMDTRQWVSIGIVDASTPDIPNVRFTKEYGPLVALTLQPSGLPVQARVVMDVAGNGEADWYPFVEGDEVACLVMEGDERNVYIVGRACQEIDRFPEKVASQDTSKNNFGFRRMRAPYIIETSASYIVRSAATGSFFGIDKTGNVTLADGNGSFIAVRADFVGLQTADGSGLIQLDTGAGTITIQSKTARLVVAESASSITTGGTLDIATAGLGATGHAITMEQVVNLFLNFLLLLTGPAGSTTLKTELTLPGKLLSATDFPAGLTAAVALWLTGAGGPAPMTAATEGQFLPTIPLLINAALLTQTNEPGVPTGLYPGVGRAGFRL